MENTTVQENKTVPEKIVAVPVEVGTVLVHGTETVTRDVAKGVSESATIIIHATKVVVSDIAEAGKQLARDAKQAVDPAPVPTVPAGANLPVKPNLTPEPASPAPAPVAVADLPVKSIIVPGPVAASAADAEEVPVKPLVAPELETEVLTPVEVPTVV